MANSITQHCCCELMAQTAEFIPNNVSENGRVVYSVLCHIRCGFCCHAVLVPRLRNISAAPAVLLLGWWCKGQQCSRRRLGWWGGLVICCTTRKWGFKPRFELWTAYVMLIRLLVLSCFHSTLNQGCVHVTWVHSFWKSITLSVNVSKLKLSLNT